MLNTETVTLIVQRAGQAALSSKYPRMISLSLWADIVLPCVSLSLWADIVLPCVSLSFWADIVLPCVSLSLWADIFLPCVSLPLWADILILTTCYSVTVGRYLLTMHFVPVVTDELVG